MTNYSMQKGRERNDKIKFIQKFILGLMLAFSIIFGMVQLFKFWDRQDSKIMSVDYCWDDNGQHYVAPNPACR